MAIPKSLFPTSVVLLWMLGSPVWRAEAILLQQASRPERNAWRSVKDAQERTLNVTTIRKELKLAREEMRAPIQVTSSSEFVDAINRLRISRGRSPLLPLPESMRDLAKNYTDSLMAATMSKGKCDHILPEWRKLEAATISSYPLVNASEVLGCSSRHSLAPARVLNQWETSDLHYNILVNRPSATHVSCAVGTTNSDSMVVCITWKRNLLLNPVGSPVPIPIGNTPTPREADIAPIGQGTPTTTRPPTPTAPPASNELTAEDLKNAKQEAAKMLEITQRERENARVTGLPVRPDILEMELLAKAILANPEESDKAWEDYQKAVQSRQEAEQRKQQERELSSSQPQMFADDAEYDERRRQERIRRSLQEINQACWDLLSALGSRGRAPRWRVDQRTVPRVVCTGPPEPGLPTRARAPNSANTSNRTRPAPRTSQGGQGQSRSMPESTPAERRALEGAIANGQLVKESGRDLSKGETKVVILLLQEGRTVRALSESTVQNVRTADFIVDGVRTELKTIQDITSKDPSGALGRRILDGAGQASHIIADVQEQAGMTRELAERAVRRAYGADKAKRIQQIRILGNGFDITVPRSQ